MSPTLPTVVIAPDKFKGSLTAAQAAAAIATGIARVVPAARVVRLPIADGGDGTVDAAIAAGWERVEVMAEDALGAPGETCYAVNGTTAIVELAQVCGLVKLAGLHPMTAGTEGLGTVIADALRRGAREVIIGLGGSASTDGGAGMLRRLGARTAGSLESGGAELAMVESLDLAGLIPEVKAASLVLAADVDNPLLGPRGAAAVFGPQKGADSGQVLELEKALTHWSRVVSAAVGTDYAQVPGSGAAGGAGFAVLAVLRGKRLSGADLVLDLVGFNDAARGADLVITGEGALDLQTLEGKGPAGVARRARDLGVPVVAVTGRNMLTDKQIREAGFGRAYPLAALEPDLTISMANAASLLSDIGAQIARDYLSCS